jgi:hypothetical protein
MYYKILYIILTVFLFRFADAQVTQEWLRSFKGSAWDITTDRTGNIFALGLNYDFFLFKYNQEGVVLWSKNVPNATFGPILFSDSSGNIFDCGHPYLTKLSPTGDSLWQVSMFDMESGIKYGAVDNQGNVYAYNGSSRLQLRKFNASGVVQWTKQYESDSGSTSDLSFSNKRIQIDNSGNVYVTGTVNKSTRSADIVTIKYSTNGDSLWTRVFDGGGGGYDRAVALTLDEYNNVYVAGVNQSTQNYFSEILKYDNNGNLVWTRFEPNTLGGVRDLVCKNGFLTFTGVSHIASGYDRATTSRYTYNGDFVWSKNYSGNDSNFSVYRLSVDGNNCSFIAGQIRSNSETAELAIVKYSIDGSVLWTNKYSAPFPNSYPFVDFELDKFNNPILFGSTRQTQDSLYVTTIKYSQTIGIENIGSEIPKSISLKQNYPNPFNPVTNIEFAVPAENRVELVIYNLLGQIVSVLIDQTLKAGEYRYTWDASSYPSGVYFYELKSGDNYERKKMILVK